MSRDLRDWVESLRRAGELVEVSAEFDPRLEITEITDRVSRRFGPVLLFTDVKGSSHPVLINTFGSERRICMALAALMLACMPKPRPPAFCSSRPSRAPISCWP